MSKQVMQQGKSWYAIHTYAGYEDAVARNLKQRIESMGMEDKIFSVLVPKEKKIKIKNGRRQVVEEKIYPGYVLVEMIVTDDSWYVVRNTPRVTGFVGSGITPTPLSEAKRFRSGSVSKSRSTRSMSQKAMQCALPTGRSKSMTARCLKSMKSAER